MQRFLKGTSLPRTEGPSTLTRSKSGPATDARVSGLLLRNVPLFANLPESQLAVLREVVQLRSCKRGTWILKGGEAVTSLRIILSGEVQVMVSDRNGAEVILDILRPGDYFGEMGLIDEQPSSATVVARDQCEFLTLSKKDFAQCLKQNASLVTALHRGLVKRIRNANGRIGSLALLDVHGRVAKVLLDMAEKDDQGRLVVRKLSRQDIAKFIGASREMVSRVLGHFESRGQIELVRSMIIIRPDHSGITPLR